MRHVSHSNEAHDARFLQQTYYLTLIDRHDRLDHLREHNLEERLPPSKAQGQPCLRLATIDTLYSSAKNLADIGRHVHA